MLSEVLFLEKAEGLPVLLGKSRVMFFNHAEFKMPGRHPKRDIRQLIGYMDLEVTNHLGLAVLRNIRSHSVCLSLILSLSGTHTLKAVVYG